MDPSFYPWFYPSVDLFGVFEAVQDFSKKIKRITQENGWKNGTHL